MAVWTDKIETNDRQGFDGQTWLEGQIMSYGIMNTIMLEEIQLIF